ncbi:MAG: HAMP domain-containing histidine kinase [Spirochaetia bacterium]|nr:HAMP domain-containing histidine kinase [Spirochaetia bacterium]
MTVVKKTFIVFLLAFIIQITVVSSLVLIGFNISISQWKEMRNRQAYETVIKMMEVDNSFDSVEFPGPLIIFNSKMEVIHSNQPRIGLKGLRDPVVPVHLDGKIVGYYSMRGTDFDDDLANKALIMTMSRILLIALGVSLIISLLAALYFSKSISHPADKLAAQLKKMTMGNMDEAVSISGDTELVQIGQAIEELRLRLIHEQDLRAQWGQDIAHDLRTPVASIRAQLEGMSDNVLSPSKERFEAMLNELLRIGTLINDFETLMVLESPEINVNLDIVFLEDLSQTFSDRFSHLLSEKNIQFVSTLEVSEIEGDTSLITRALSNLILNACHYANEGSTITLHSYIHPQGKAVSVHNRGLVISDEEKERIFDRLYRGEFARKTPGSGLGLTIVYQIAQLHKAKIYVESSQKQGTEFTLIFP